MKTLLAMVLVAAFALGGCSGGGSDTKSSTTVTKSGPEGTETTTFNTEQ